MTAPGTTGDTTMGSAWATSTPLHGSRADTLVDARWVAEHMGQPGVVLMHVDGDSSGYYAAHLPQALPLDWHDELHERTRRGPLSQHRFEELMQRKGIDPESHVVLYGTGEGVFAAHAYWLFRYYQHERVSLLDGGLRAWTRSGGRLEEAVPRVRGGGEYRSPGPDTSLRVRREELISRYTGAPDGVVLLDCRTPQEFAGKHRHPLDLGIEHHRVGGHIPGARNLPTGEMLQPDGTFVSVDRLRQLFAARGVRDDSDVVVYCRAAERSSLPWFVLHELLQHPHVRHYDGGWTEYGSLLDVPVERDD